MLFLVDITQKQQRLLRGRNVLHSVHVLLQTSCLLMICSILLLDLNGTKVMRIHSQYQLQYGRDQESSCRSRDRHIHFGNVGVTNSFGLLVADINMLCNRNTMQVYDMDSVQSANEDVQPHLMFAHFVTGCVTTSAVLVKGEVKALDNISSKKDWSCLEVLREPQSTHGDIRTAGGYFMFKQYDYISAQSLNKQTHNIQPEPWLSIPDLFIYDRNSASSSAAAKFHLYQTYHSVQQRLGNDIAD